MYIRKISSYASLDCKSRNGDKIEHGKGVTGLHTRFSHNSQKALRTYKRANTCLPNEPDDCMQRYIKYAVLSKVLVYQPSSHRPNSSAC